MWLTLLRNPVVWAAIAFAVGIASGAEYTRRVKNGEIAEIRLAETQQRLQGWETAERVNRETRESWQKEVNALRSRPPRVVRICTAPATVPADGDGTAGVAGEGPGEDIGRVLAASLEQLYEKRAVARAASPAP